MINEAIGLASMNPVPGNASNNRGVILVNSIEDKDLKNNNTWGNCRIMRDMTNKYGIEVNNDGKLDLIENSDLENKYISVYIVKSPFSEKVFNEVLSEIDLHIQERPIHSKSYLYEIFTGHPLYTPDQFDYEPLLEKIDLDKLSKQLSSENNLDIQEKKDIHYSLGNPYRASGNQIEDDVSFSPLMASAEIDEEY